MMAGESSLPDLRPGFMIKKEYRVEKKLGEGGFGAVYLMENMRSGEKCAMKVENNREKIQVLKMEVAVLKEVTQRGGRHVCKIIDRGRNDLFNYVIMTVVGQSLGDLRKACPGSKFSSGTALGVGIQCLEALEDLHNIGYLHRDVKPGNFACGREEMNQQHTIYILDFGLARKFLNEKGQLRTPRATAGFRGTVRYAPLSCHQGRELSRKDDLETWFYQQIEITKGRVPWAMIAEKEEVGQQKQKSRMSGDLTRDTPRQYGTIMDYIDRLKYWDTPDYQYLYNLLRQALQERRLQETAPYDWERGGEHRQLTIRLPPPLYNPHGDAPHINF